MKKISVVLCAVLVTISISGCMQVRSEKEEGTTLAKLPETRMETPSIEESSLETMADETMRDHAHNIFEGTMDQTEIKMRISREGGNLTAAYITRADEEKIFDGEMKSPTEFELHDEDGGYLKGTVNDGSLNGAGLISGENVSLEMHLTTFHTIGSEYENYYSGDALPRSPEEVETFARRIKGGINDKEKFVGLFWYPLDILVKGEAVTVSNEEDMGRQYDILMAETDFGERIETMYTKYLFANYRGVCVESGMIWFDKDENGEYKIRALSY